ncbi:hypothetical protein ILUMI_18473 [Ignelater luminosus]|uniref:Reverse transcriptase domain-containing protein n=1 Tax=Ignelater luminosus TaxID=2038154 RepID=A0A8K0G6I6_IGNLU|nr:hypothetical protein ILUMI_18473 [Ignelater luminosus]
MKITINERQPERALHLEQIKKRRERYADANSDHIMVRDRLKESKQKETRRRYDMKKLKDEKLRSSIKQEVKIRHTNAQTTGKYLDKQLQTHAEEVESYVKKTGHFIELLKKETVQSDHLLVSFDVVSLFTNVPVGETLKIIRRKHKPPDHIIDLTKHCLKNTYFIYKDERYKQIEGALMGSPLSPVIADLFMEDLETQALQRAIRGRHICNLDTCQRTIRCLLGSPQQHPPENHVHHGNRK